MRDIRVGVVEDDASACQKVLDYLNRYQSESDNAGAGGDKSILIDVRGSPQRLELTDVLYVESIRHTIIIHTLSGKLSVTGTLKSFEERLATHEWRQREHDAEYGEA